MAITAEEWRRQEQQRQQERHAPLELHARLKEQHEIQAARDLQAVRALPRDREFSPPLVFERQMADADYERAAEMWDGLREKRRQREAMTPAEYDEEMRADGWHEAVRQAAWLERECDLFAELHGYRHPSRNEALVKHKSVDGMEDGIAAHFRSLARMEYGDYLLTDEWHLVREFAIQRACRRCQVCNVRERLEVHHRTYEWRGTESLDDVTVLCHLCHERLHTAPVPPQH